MRKNLMLLAILVVGFLFTGRAQAQVQIFGGYSYLRPSVDVPTTTICGTPPCPVTLTPTTLNLNGWEASASFNPIRILGFTADFSRNSGTVQGSDIHVQTYLFGPQVRFPGSISPFAHALFGAAQETIASSSTVAGSSATAFAWAAGGGLDVKLVPFVSLRLFQIDDLMTRFDSGTQHQLRASAGLVVHF
jgi:hypothetical protein